VRDYSGALFLFDVGAFRRHRIKKSGNGKESTEKGIIHSKSIIVDTTHTLSRSNPFSAIEVLRERSKLLRKTGYIFDDQFKERMPQKNTDNDLEKELAYCKELETRLENELSISSIPAVKEKLNLLKETVEDTQENLTLSKDTDAKIGHKSA
jgi:hypothetical protein